MDFYTWTHQWWPTSKGWHLSTLCGHWMQSRGPAIGMNGKRVSRESVLSIMRMTFYDLVFSLLCITLFFFSLFKWLFPSNLVFLHFLLSIICIFISSVYLRDLKGFQLTDAPVSHKHICFEAIQNSGKSECSTLEQRSIMKFLLAEKWKPCEIYGRMCNVFREACFIFLVKTPLKMN